MKDWRDELGSDPKKPKPKAKMDHAKQNNLNMIHWDNDGRYMCNKVCNSYDIKLTKDFKKVTCLNCKSKIIGELTLK